MVPQVGVMDQAESCVEKNNEETIDVAVAGENGCFRKEGKSV